MEYLKIIFHPLEKLGTEPILSDVHPMWFGVNGPLFKICSQVTFLDQKCEHVGTFVHQEYILQSFDIINNRHFVYFVFLVILFAMIDISIEHLLYASLYLSYEPS